MTKQTQKSQKIGTEKTMTQGAAKGGRQKEFDHFFSFSGHFWSLFGHLFWRFCHFFRHFFARLLLPDSFCGRVNDSQRRDKILRFSLRPENGQFSPHLARAMPLLNYTLKHLEKRENNPLEITQKKSSGDGAPKLQISVPCRGRTCPEKRIILSAGVRKPGKITGINSREKIQSGNPQFPDY